MGASMISKLYLFDKYYNLGIKAVNEIYEQYLKHNLNDNYAYITQNTIDNIGLKDIDKDNLSYLDVSIPKYKYMYRDLDGNLLTYNDMNYYELVESVKLGLVIREPKFYKYNNLRLYLLDIGNIDISKFRLDINKVLKELKCNNINELCIDLEKRYKFRCIKDIQNYLNLNWNVNIDSELEEETLYLINLLSKISERLQFIDVQEEFLEERVTRLVCECNALEVREKIEQGV